MKNDAQPALATLLPHRAPMLLLEAIAVKTPTELVATSSQDLCTALLPGRPLSGLLAIELLAQAAAAFAGLSSADSAAEAAIPAVSAPPATPGMLLGGRKLELNERAVLEVDCLFIGIALRSPLGRGGLAKFVGTLWAPDAADSAELKGLMEAQPAAPFTDRPMQWLTERLAEQWLARSDVSVYLPA